MSEHSAPNWMKRLLENGFMPLLGWSDRQSAGIFRLARQRYMEEIALSLSSYLSSGNADRRALKTRLLSLPSPLLQRLLLAPELCRRLTLWERGQNCDLDTFIETGIAVEQLGTGDGIPLLPRSPAWSALGDRSVSERSGGGCFVSERQPTLADTAIIIDWKSPPERFRLNDSTFTHARPATDQEATTVIDKLSAAISVISAACPGAYELIRQNVMSIQLYGDKVDSDAYTSSSSRSYCGRVALVNAHLPHVDAAVLINALIHEAIHNFFYRIEYIMPFVNNIHEAMQINIASPWSEKMLKLPTYIHACYIYYSLQHFWQHHALARFFSPEQRQAQLDGFIAGFRKNRARLTQPTIIAAVNPSITQALLRMSPPTNVPETVDEQAYP